MRFVGVDIASETHVVAMVDEKSEMLVKPTPFTEDALGYEKLLGLLGEPGDTLVAMEATGHYWKNLVAQDFGDRLCQLHRLVDLGFPEFTRYVRSLDSELASAILHDYPTAEAFQGVSVKRLARLRYDGRHKVGEELASALVDAATRSVGRHHGEAYRVQVRYACEDLDTLRRRLRELDRDIERKLSEHQVGTLLTTIDGIGPLTAARLIAELGDPANFRDAGALAAYVGVIPAVKQSGKSKGARAGLTPIGHAALRAALWMPTLTAVRKNPWLRVYYEGLRARGKLPKVALVASMRKLLAAVYSVAKNRRPFVPQLATAEVRS